MDREQVQQTRLGQSKGLTDVKDSRDDRETRDRSRSRERERRYSHREDDRKVSIRISFTWWL